jgi:hypothetical protein
MQRNGEVLNKFYDAVVRRDIGAARAYLADDLVFEGLFETYRSANEYIAALTGLLQVTVRLDVKTIIAEGNNAAVFFELETKAPAEGTVLVAEWHQFKDGKITHVASRLRRPAVCCHVYRQGGRIRCRSPQRQTGARTRKTGQCLLRHSPRTTITEKKEPR